MGRRALGGRFLNQAQKGLVGDRGAQFLCVSDEGSHFGQVLRFLEQNGVVTQWSGRFGVLGSRGGGFLPKDVIDSSVISGMRAIAEHEPESINGASNAGDFFGFISSGSKSRLYVGNPSMSSICERLRSLADLHVQQHTRVTDIRLDGALWDITFESLASPPEDEPETESGFHAVVLASHNPTLAAGVVRDISGRLDRDSQDPGADPETSKEQAQFAKRLQRLAEGLSDLRTHQATPLLTFAAEYPHGSLSSRLPFDAVICPTSPHIHFIAREGSKPGRPADAEQESWTAVSTPEFAAELLSQNLSEAQVTRHLHKQFSYLVAPFFKGGVQAVPEPISQGSTPWRAAFTAKTLNLQEDCISLEPWRLAISGDFLRRHPSPIEGAAMSGLEAGERVASWFASGGGA